jgi:hypothetical protein
MVDAGVADGGDNGGLAIVAQRANFDDPDLCHLQAPGDSQANV